MALQVLVYSDDITVRRKVIQGIGARPDSALPPLEFVEVATGPMVIERLAAPGSLPGIDLAIWTAKRRRSAGWVWPSRSRTRLMRRLRL
ncbi:response regulatory protein [Mycobacteroides abscessus]|nr:response regulatory protein [Mycobacteroides abscessus]